MRTKLIGLGAAGNKAAIYAVNSEVFQIKDVMLLNSTLKDIPAEYQSREGATCYQYTNSYGGCGKERKKSYELCENTLKAETINLGGFLRIDSDDEAELAILVTSTEGGTGSGSTPLIARYIKQVYGIPVHVFGISGFEDDVRGMRNTVDFFKEMEEDFTVECIKNAKFLPDCNGNKFKAEEAANKEFVSKISVLMGLQIRDSAHNIDPTDLLKLSTEEGYMLIETHIFNDKIKNADQFRSAVVDMLDSSKALDCENPSQKKLGIIINIKEENTDYIDYNDIITERLGLPYEKYEHVQHEDTMPEFISIISGGLKMPIEEVENTYNKYKQSVERVNKSQDDFFSTIREKEIDPTDKQFDLASKKKTISKDAFFSSAAQKINKGKSAVISDPNDEY